MALSSETILRIRDSLLSGSYSLLLGAGVSLDSKNRDGNKLLSGNSLRQELIKLKNLKETSSLARAYSQLNDEEIKLYITDRFVGCTPGPTIALLRDFIWKRIYTFNIDDCIENSYKTASLQKCIPFTHKDSYRNPEDVDALHVVHLHGWSHLPEKGYIFSLAEYAGAMGPGSAWTNVLAQTISSEPFIIAGANLEEPDLEYFLRGRSAETARTDRGPSFLVDPNPDAGTEKDCARHGLILYAGTFEAFLKELISEFPARPLPRKISPTLKLEMFKTAVTQRELALFSRDFTYLSPVKASENTDYSFYVGREPTINDIALDRDIARSSTNRIKKILIDRISTKKSDSGFIIFHGNAGVGKSTVILRSLYDLASQGVHTFIYSGISAMDIGQCSRIFANFGSPFIIFCDNFADHASVFHSLFRDIPRADFCIVGVERSYRLDHIFRSLAGTGKQEHSFDSFKLEEARYLIRKMESYGLTSRQYVEAELETNASQIIDDSIATAVCRIMNDFRPIERIIASLISDADQARIIRYLASALAVYCYRQGLRYSILTSNFYEKPSSFKEQFFLHDILPLCFSDNESRDYVIPMNPILGQRILREVSANNKELILEIYCDLGSSISSYVDRHAIQRRAPEARLAGRLFDFDDVVSPFLGDNSAKFYIRMKKYWDWNSRYWEQVALMNLDAFAKSGHPKNMSFLLQAISHAKHAVKIEKHPLPLTTLGKILMEDMKYNATRFRPAYNEAFDHLYSAINIESRMSRIAVHPYSALLLGSRYYLENGGKLEKNHREKLIRILGDIDRFFNSDVNLGVAAANIRPYLN